MSTDATGRRIYTTLDSPIGGLTVTASGGAIDGLFMDGQRHTPPATAGWVREDTAFTAVAAQLERYFAGEQTIFDVPLRPSGTAFQERVWAGLREIPYGETISYGELARRLGTPGASRAVGLANGRNPISIIIPCHRVIGADGSLTGYGGGLERKSWLLDHEAAVVGTGTLALV
jgi:methylated-DNA-[protein]-cysteine S-methyltransferase